MQQRCFCAAKTRHQQMYTDVHLFTVPPVGICETPIKSQLFDSSASLYNFPYHYTDLSQCYYKQKRTCYDDHSSELFCCAGKFYLRSCKDDSPSGSLHRSVCRYTRQVHERIVTGVGLAAQGSFHNSFKRGKATVCFRCRYGVVPTFDKTVISVGKCRSC